MGRYSDYGNLVPTMKPMDKEKPEKAEAKPAEFECACFTCPSQEACKAAQEAEKAAPVADYHSTQDSVVCNSDDEAGEQLNQSFLGLQLEIHG